MHNMVSCHPVCLKTIVSADLFNQTFSLKEFSHAALLRKQTSATVYSQIFIR